MQRTNSAEQDQLHGAPTTHARGPQSAQSLPSKQEPNSEPGPPSEHMLLNLWRQVLVQLVLADTGIIIRGITSGSRRNRGPEAAAWGLPTPPVGGSMPLFGRRNSNRPAICRFRPWKDSLAWTRQGRQALRRATQGIRSMQPMQQKRVLVSGSHLECE